MMHTKTFLPAKKFHTVVSTEQTHIQMHTNTHTNRTQTHTHTHGCNTIAVSLSELEFFASLTVPMAPGFGLALALTGLLCKLESLSFESVSCGLEFFNSSNIL